MAALFGSKKEKKVMKTEKVAKKVAAASPVSVHDLKPGRLLSPRITEKAAYGSEEHVYVFNVRTDATKKQIAQEIKAVYNVVPAKVNIAQIPAKRIVFKGYRGQKSGGKKAYVYLKKGDSIEII